MRALGAAGSTAGAGAFIVDAAVTDATEAGAGASAETLDTIEAGGCARSTMDFFASAATLGDAGALRSSAAKPRPANDNMIVAPTMTDFTPAPFLAFSNCESKAFLRN
jgi:hypothetical protein